MKEFVVNKNDSGLRLDKFLNKAVKKLPNSLLYKYIRTKRIKINNKRCSFNQPLSQGDIVSLYIADEFFVENLKMDFLLAPNKLDIVFEDENILLVNKNQGLSVHEDENEKIDTLINRILHYLYQKNEYNPENEQSFIPALCNRIDRNTSGIVIAAKNANALRIVNEQIKNRQIIKKYLCVVVGEPKQKSGEFIDYLKKDENKNIVEISKTKKVGFKTIITAYKVIAQNNNKALVEVDLKTGRTHQIRAHLAFHNMPLLGDGKYGNNTRNKVSGYKYQALCAYKLTFIFEKDSDLFYLNNKTFEVKDIWFRDDF